MDSLWLGPYIINKDLGEVWCKVTKYCLHNLIIEAQFFFCRQESVWTEKLGWESDKKESQCLSTEALLWKRGLSTTTTSLTWSTTIKPTISSLLSCIRTTEQKKKSKDGKAHCALCNTLCWMTVHLPYRFPRTKYGNLAWIFAALTEELSGMGC